MYYNVPYLLFFFFLVYEYIIFFENGLADSEG